MEMVPKSRCGRDLTIVETGRSFLMTVLDTGNVQVGRPTNFPGRQFWQCPALHRHWFGTCLWDLF